MQMMPKVMQKHRLVETGVVKFFSGFDRYGFIVSDDGSEIFFHMAQVIDVMPAKGDRVEFRVGRSDNGKPRAEHVRVI